MKRSIITAAVIVALVPPTGFVTLARAAAPPSETGVNGGVVQLEMARAAGISVRIAEDLANLINDGGVAGFAGHRQRIAAEHHRPPGGSGSTAPLHDLFEPVH